MGKSFRIGEASVGHHRTQFGKPRFGEGQSRQALAGVEPHQPAVQKPSGDRRELRLAGFRAAPPGLEREAFGHVEKNKSSSRRIYARSPGVNPVTGTFLVMRRLSKCPASLVREVS
jgi:hypothetical protein